MMGTGRLVLARRQGEAIALMDGAGRHIALLTIISIASRRVALSIEADPEITVHRGELPGWRPRANQQTTVQDPKAQDPKTPEAANGVAR